jgi:hypothetical protein
MKCQKCNCSVSEMTSHDHYGQILCDDCYMDALSPARSCDPWSVHSAKRLEAAGGKGLQLNDVQQRIVQFLKEVGEAERATICEQLKIDPDTLQREIAALRHMERVRGKPKEDGKVVICLW